ncbi:MAG: phage portal protein [Clostridiales bacterium]|nr:phage portal protein [Clostridiales bacterium]
MSIIDLLLETDVEKLQAKHNKNYEIKRLSKALGEKFIITCYPLTHEQVAHIGEISKTNTDMKLNAVLEACRIEGKRFNNKELMDKFGVVTPTDLLNKLFLPGELYEIYEVINTLSGYSKDAVKEVKNS